MVRFRDIGIALLTIKNLNISMIVLHLVVCGTNIVSVLK